MRRRVSSRLQEYPFLSKISFCSHAAEAILFVDLKKTAKHDVIIPDYSKYSALWSRMFGIHSMYSGIGIASQSNGCSGLLLLFLFRNSVNRTHPKMMLHGGTTCNNDFQRNTPFQHYCDIVSNVCNIVPTLLRCVAQKIVIANRSV